MPAQSFRGSNAGKPGGKEEPMEQAPPEVSIPTVSVKAQPRTHKVIQFGYTVTVDGEVPDPYRFQYPVVAENPDDLYPGVIPAGFSAEVGVGDSAVFMHTRQGNMSPEYQVCFDTVDNILVDYNDSLDAVWMEALSALEEHEQLDEEALDFLDGDPLYIFGIADPNTQKALEKASSVPMLKCLEQKPVIGEWFAYLNADPGVEKPYTWVVESFSEVELPAPWTSYKGVGSIVCYLNNETNETTWKHPFYDYFAQLLDHCRRATPEEHIKLRINRMLWSYEADCAQDISQQQPLLSPSCVQSMADVLGIDLKDEPFMVGTLKTFLKAFSQQYRLEEDLDVQEIKWCRDIVENERTKHKIAKLMKEGGDNSRGNDEEDENIKPTVHAQLYCVECGVLATSYCPQCADCMCEDCYERIHSKGNRRQHTSNFLIPCSLCEVFPAKLQCTYSFGNFCHECYARKHVKTLPRFLDLKPVKIDYTATNPINYKRGGNKPDDMPHKKEQAREIESTLGDTWHAFYDLRGIKYYYNFESQESMRRPADDMALEDIENNVTLRNLAQNKDAKRLKMYATIAQSQAPGQGRKSTRATRKSVAPKIQGLGALTGGW